MKYYPPGFKPSTRKKTKNKFGTGSNWASALQPKIKKTTVKRKK